MRAVIQRVREASVRVEGDPVGVIGHGLVVLVAVQDTDTEADVTALADKVVRLRVFGDEMGRMNRSLLDVGGSALIVSQFTLAADVRKGRRPSFTRAAEPGIASEMVDLLADAVRGHGVPVAEGRFGAMMSVQLVNDGPVTIVLDVADGGVLDTLP